MDALLARVTPGCPVRTTLEMLGGKWRLLLLHQLVAGARRFSELKVLMPDISEKVLMQELKQLVTAELVERIPLSGTASRGAYLLTPIGHRALPVLQAVAEFGFAYADYIQAGRSTTGLEVTQ